MLQRLFSAPDVFNRGVGYTMAPMTDYEEQTESQNRIRDTVISATRRVICYNQPIYNDERLEVSEYAGLQLSVIKSDIIVVVEKNYDNAAILILDDDSKLLLHIIILDVWEQSHQYMGY